MSIRSVVGRLFGRAEATGRDPLADAPDRVVLGLGNPGPEYALTRHNAGFRVVEHLAARHDATWSDAPALDARVARPDLDGLDCLLVEPLTFMNRSGRTAAAIADRWPALDFATQALVVFDDLDLPVGRIRLRGEGGGGGQRGMTDILDALETRAVPRLRFGVGHPGASGQAVIDWVLSPFDPADADLVAETVDRAANAIEVALRDGLAAAMGRFNARS